MNEEVERINKKVADAKVVDIPDDLRMLDVYEVANILHLGYSQVRNLLRLKILSGIQLCLPGANRGKWLVPLLNLFTFELLNFF